MDIRHVIPLVPCHTRQHVAVPLAVSRPAGLHRSSYARGQEVIVSPRRHQVRRRRSGGIPRRGTVGDMQLKVGDPLDYTDLAMNTRRTPGVGVLSTVEPYSLALERKLVPRCMEAWDDGQTRGLCTDSRDR